LISSPSNAVINSPDHDTASIKSGMKSPVSIKSSKSSWSNPLSAAKSSYESAPSTDQEAIKRSAECQQLIDLQKEHGEELSRFFEFEQHLLNELRSQRDLTKQLRSKGHREIIVDKQSKVRFCAICDGVCLTYSRSRKP
jgi:hypothetical protein